MFEEPLSTRGPCGGPYGQAMTTDSINIIFGLNRKLDSRDPHKRNSFITTLRLKFNILNPLNKKLSKGDTGGGSYITGFMSSEFLRIQEFVTF